MITELNIRTETIKLLELNLGGDFLDLTLKAKATKGKINKWDYIKLVSSQQRKPTNERATYGRGGNVCKSCIWLGVNILYMYICVLIQLHNRNNNPVKKWTEYLNRHFSKEDIKWPIGTWEGA